MKQFKLTPWKEDGEDMDLSKVLYIVLTDMKGDKVARGIEYFDVMTRIGKILTEAQLTKVMNMEEVDYMFLKNAIKENIPATWGLNEPLSEEVNKFLNI